MCDTKKRFGSAYFCPNCYFYSTGVYALVQYLFRRYNCRWKQRLINRKIFTCKIVKNANLKALTNNESDVF